MWSGYFKGPLGREEGGRDSWSSDTPDTASNLGLLNITWLWTSGFVRDLVCADGFSSEPGCPVQYGGWETPVGQ